MFLFLFSPQNWYSHNLRVSMDLSFDPHSKMCVNRKATLVSLLFVVIVSVFFLSFSSILLVAQASSVCKEENNNNGASAKDSSEVSARETKTQLGPLLPSLPDQREAFFFSLFFHPFFLLSSTGPAHVCTPCTRFLFFFTSL